MALVTSVRRESACSQLSEPLPRGSSGLPAGHLPHLAVQFSLLLSLSLSLLFPISLLLFLPPPWEWEERGISSCIGRIPYRGFLGPPVHSKIFCFLLSFKCFSPFFPFFFLVFLFLMLSICIERKSFPDFAANPLVLIPVWCCHTDHRCGVGENGLKGPEQQLSTLPTLCFCSARGFPP